MRPSLRCFSICTPPPQQQETERTNKTNATNQLRQSNQAQRPYAKTDTYTHNKTETIHLSCIAVKESRKTPPELQIKDSSTTIATAQDSHERDSNTATAREPTVPQRQRNDQLPQSTHDVITAVARPVPKRKTKRTNQCHVVCVAPLQSADGAQKSLSWKRYGRFPTKMASS